VIVRVAAFVAAITASSLAAQTTARAPIVAVTAHATTIGGRAVSYDAIVGETFVRDSAGTPVASMVTTAYVRSDVRDKSARPVMFLFNGGPGASSTPLHFGAFGPMRRADETGGRTIVANPDSPLDVVDLVFIDPIGTGYSRPFPGVDGKRFWSRTSDARSVREVIEDWLEKNGRERSPLYLCGESYGTTRAALILENPGTLAFNGVLLFAVVANPPTAELRDVGNLPTYATTAWFHERVPRNEESVEQVYARAVEFARGEYAAEIAKGAPSSPSVRHLIADKLAALIGLSVPFVEAQSLRIEKDSFMFNLLKDRSVRTGQLDSRATRSFDAPKERGPYDDPGMNYNPERVGNATASGGASPVDAYFKTALAFNTGETYNALNLDVNGAWNHEGMTDVNPAFGRAMARDPKLRMFSAGGYYDLSTPLLAAQMALEQAGVPASRLTMAAFVAGHSVFVEAKNRAALSNAVRKFVLEKEMRRGP